MRKVIIIAIVITAILVSFKPQSAALAKVCPAVANAYAAQLDILESGGIHYLIDPLAQGLPAAQGNVARLQYASRPPRWLVGGIKVDPAWRYKYHISYFDNNWRPVGEAWFATLTGYDGVYFYFVMPAGEADHPNCGYGSVSRAFVDGLLKPRK